MTLAFLGPAFSFSERAAHILGEGEALVPLEDIAALVSAVATGASDRAVIPIENSQAGTVPAAVNALVALEQPLQVLGETALPIRFSLYRNRHDDAALTGVISHAMSLKQCAGWIASHGVETQEVGSNGTAFIRVRDETQPGWGAIAPSDIEDEAMTPVERDLQGESVFRTRFLLGAKCPSDTAARAAVVAVDDLTALEGCVSARAHLCLPSGELGGSTTIVEVRFAEPRALGAIPGRALLAWADGNAG